jgi:hypothetical protein
MAGLAAKVRQAARACLPAIHVFAMKKGVDARDRRGHDARDEKKHPEPSVGRRQNCAQKKLRPIAPPPAPAAISGR